MSIENLDAERRGHYDVFPLSIRRHNCCSFCRQPGHNVTTCNSSRLREFEAICSSQVLQTNTPDDFKNWLIENYMSEQLLIKTFTIKKFRVTTRTSIENCIDLITEYIFRIYKNTNETNETNEIEYNNYIFENDLITFIQALSNERQEIYEDRNITEIQRARAMENMLMREMFISLMSMSNYITIRDEYKKIQIVSTINKNENLSETCECSICYDEKEFQKFVKFGCKHEFCKDCVISTIKSSNNKHLCCALCRDEVREIETRTEQVKTELEEIFI